MQQHENWLNYIDPRM